MTETPVQPKPVLLDLEQAIDEFRQSVKPWLDPQQEDQWDGVKLKEKETAILQAGLRLVGRCVAILIQQLVLTESVKRAARVRVARPAGSHSINQAFKEVTLTLIGGVQVRVKTLYQLTRRSRPAGPGRKRKRGKRGRSQGQGLYPVLALLGIREGTTPLLRCRISQAATQAASFEQARQIVAWLGLDWSARRIRRISRAFCQVGLQQRADQLARWHTGQMPAGTVLQGQRVVVSVDGGRLRIRQPHCTGRKRKSGRRGYQCEWKEPKLLTIYVLDEQGRKVTGTDMPLVCDGTLLGLEEFMQLLSMYLHALGIATADSIVLIGDGAPWIWEQIPPVLYQLGCQPEQVTQILDYGHAVDHLYQLAEALFGIGPRSQAWARTWAKRLKQGHVAALLNEIRRCLTHKKRCKTAQREYAYFEGHHAHARLDYARFQHHHWPIGSGAIESLVRQTVNLRLKSAGKLWLLETAEAFLHARCQWAAHQWANFCDAVLTFGLAPVATI
jgi:hypothetical protein